MESEIKRLIKALKKFWWSPLLLAVMLAPVTWLAGKSMASTYVASTQLMIIQPVAGQTSVIGEGQQIRTYTQLVESGPVLDRVIIEFGLDLSRFDLARKIETRILPGTNIVEIQIRDDDPQRAADLTNSLARHVETQVSELTLGQLQDNLDDLTANSNVLKDRLIVLNTRIDELEASASVEDTETQVQLSGLREERLQVEQSLADIESTIRVLNTELQTSVVPVVIVDTAQAPTSPQNPSALILGGLGFVLGLLIGGCIILYVAYRNHSVIDREHLESLSPVDVVATLSPQDDAKSDSPESAFLLNFIKLRLDKSSSSHVEMVTPRNADVDDKLIAAIQDQARASGVEMNASPGILDTVGSIHSVAGSQSALLMVKQGSTTSEDYLRAVAALRDLEIELIGTVMIES